MSKQSLADQIRNKDENAFDKLYDEYNKLVFYVIYQIVKDKESTKDLVQEVFLTIYDKIDQYSGGNFKYWILQIAKNLAINYHNRVISKDNLIVKDDVYVENLEDKKSKGLGKYDDILNRYFEQEEKDLIVYHVVFGYTYPELAEVFGSNAKAIGKKCRRLLNILKNIIKED